MQSDDPAFLPVGTEVSAKFKGAFCEAKVKKIIKSVKCKVSLKETPFGSVIVEEHLIKGGPLEVNSLVDVTQGKHTVKALIQHVKDCSSYHVVFNDGDEKILRRSQMCLKGAKHFDSAVSLDALPLYNPEQFSSPVVKGVLGKNKKGKKRKGDDISPSKRTKKRKEDEESEDEKGKKREKRAAASAATVAIGEIDQGDTEISGEGEDSSSGNSSDREKDKEREKKKNDREDERKEAEKKSQKDKSDIEKRERDKTPFQMGDVICVYEEPQRRGKWFPAVVVAYKAYRDGALKPRTLSKKEIPVRSFQNGKYAGVMTNHLSWFDHNSFGKKTMDGMSSALKTAIDRAQVFIDRGTLPGSWVLKELYADEIPPKRKELEERAEREIKKEKKEEKERKEKEKKDEKVDKEDKREKKKEKSEKEKPLKPSAAASESSCSESSDEEEYGEERDLFVAQLYKFQEERGTPINRAPVLGGKDIDLYRFYRVVQDYGGCKRVTTNQKWKKVLTKLKLEGCAGATPVTVRKAYVRYLSHFNSFYKRLGWSLDELAATSTINSPRERRLIRPTDIVIQKGKRRKSNVGDVKEKVEKKEIKKEKSEEIDDTKSIIKESEVVVENRDKEKKDEKIDRLKRESSSPAIFVAPNDKIKRVEKEKDDVEYKKEDKDKKKDKREIKEEDDKDRKKEANKIDKKDKKEKVKDKEEKNKESDPDTEKEKELKKDKKEREGDASEDEMEGKRKKEKKKLSMKSDRKGDSIDFVKSKDPDEGYNPANIFSHFYLGQKVRAHHHGRWYDARVVTVEQPNVKEIVEVILLPHEGETELSADSVSRLHSLMCATRCFVHYLGWNSRYDEWITLNKIRLSIKDEQASMDLVWRAVDNRVPTSRIDWVLAWSHSPEGVDSLHRDDDTAPLNLFSMGGYRPRRVSISQYEQFSAAVVADGLKREQSKSSPIVAISSSPGKTLISPCPMLTTSKSLIPNTGSNIYVKTESLSFSTSFVSSLRSPSRVYESTGSPVRESKRVRTTSLSRDLNKDVPSTSTSPVRPQSPVKLPQEISRTFEIISPLYSSDSKCESDYISSFIFLSPVTAVVSLTCKEPPSKEKEKKSPFRINKVERDQEKDTEKDFIKESKNKRRRRESDAEEKEFESLEEEAKAVCLLRHPSQDESDAAPSGSETPQRTDGEDNDKWSVSDNQSVSGRMMSPGRGRGMKRKRVVHNRHSQMVVDRKYVRGKQKDKDDKKDDDSDGEEEEEEVARDTFISMKNKVHRMMEQEQSLENFVPLGFAPLEDIMMMPEAEIVEIFERRLNELREIYQHSKADLLMMDKKRRRQIEKRKERERALREASTLPSTEK